MSEPAVIKTITYSSRFMPGCGEKSCAVVHLTGMDSFSERKPADLPQGATPGTDEPADLRTALIEFTEAIEQLRKDALSDTDCARLGSLLDALTVLRRNHSGPHV